MEYEYLYISITSWKIQRLFLRNLKIDPHNTRKKNNFTFLFDMI